MIILPTSSGGCFPMQHYPVKSPKASRSQRSHYRRTFHGVDSKRGPSFALKSPFSRGNYTNKASKILLSLLMCKGVICFDDWSTSSFCERKKFYSSCFFIDLLYYIRYPFTPVYRLPFYIFELVFNSSLFLQSAALDLISYSELFINGLFSTGDIC